MRKNKIFLLLTSQIFLALTIVLGLDLLYRWESVTRGLQGVENFTMIAPVIIPLFIVALLLACFFVGIYFLVRRLSPRWSDHLFVIFRYVMVSIVLWGVFLTEIRFLGSKIYHFEYAGGAIGDAIKNTAFLIALTLALFYIIAYRRAQRRVASDDHTRILGVLLFFFILASAIVGLTFLLVYHWEDGKIYFQQYGFLLFVGYVILHRRHIMPLMYYRRIYVFPAVALFSASLLAVVFFALGASQSLATVGAELTDRGFEHPPPKLRTSFW